MNAVNSLHGCCHLKAAMSVGLLVQFLELHHLEEDVLKDMFGILLILGEFTGYSKNVTTLSDIEFQVFVSTAG